MNGGAPGLAGAPVTKAILVAVGASSLLAQARRGPVGAAAALVSFTSPVELALGAALLYHGRLLERTTGSSAYAAGAAVASVVGRALAALAARALGAAPPAAGPYALAFANLVPYVCDIPPVTTLAGGRVSDKAWVYGVAVQLAACGGRAAALPAAAGLVAGLLLRADVGGLGSLRVGGGGVGGVGGVDTRARADTPLVPPS
jgi:hypothetical protein